MVNGKVHEHSILSSLAVFFVWILWRQQTLVEKVFLQESGGLCSTPASQLISSVTWSMSFYYLNSFSPIRKEGQIMFPQLPSIATLSTNGYHTRKHVQTSQYQRNIKIILRVWKNILYICILLYRFFDFI